MPTLVRPLLSLLLLCFTAQQVLVPGDAFGQTAAVSTAAPHALFIDILQGEGALNDVRARTAREPIVEIRDENHKPVAGVVVLFVIDSNGGGLGATFNGAQAFSMTTGEDGQAFGRGFQLTRTTGKFHISVDARQGNLHTRGVINQTNLLQLSSIGLVNELATVASSKSGLVALLEIAAMGAVTGTVIALNPGSPVTVTTGTGSVGAPSTSIRIQLHRRNR